MANESHLSYGKNTIALKTAPLAGENLNVYLRPGDELKSSIDLSKAQFQIVGTDVVATLPNGGKITFVSLGMMVFEDNPPIIKLPNDDRLLVTDILNKVQNISQASKDSILTSGDVILQSDEKSDSAAASKKSDDPVVDYNAYYVDPQPNIKPQDEIGPKDNVGKYLTESPSFTSNETSNATSTQNYSSSETQSHSKDNIADVSAALTFDIGFYQIKSSDSTATVAGVTTTTVLGGTGSALGNVSKLASAQFEPETIDYRNNPNVQVITADDPTYVAETYLTKLVRMSISQPIGFGIVDIAIMGLGSGFQILNSNGTSANATGGGWDLVPGTGFTSIATDGGEIIEFYVKYEPANVTVNTDNLMQVNLTSIFDMNNVPLLMQPGVVVPILDTLTSVKDIGVIVKPVTSEAGYTYTGQYEAGFVLDTTPNENIIYTGTSNSTVHGGLSNDTIYGNIGDDSLYGGGKNDTLSGGAGTNIINGGNDTLAINADGIDTVNYDFIEKNYTDAFRSHNSGALNVAHPQGVVVNLQTGVATGGTIYDTDLGDEFLGETLLAISDTLVSIENVVGSKFDDTITGSDSVANMLYGGEGDDALDGGSSGGNYLYGQAGNDWLTGSTHDAKIDGGDGKDTIDFSNNPLGVEVALDIGSIKDIGAAASTTIILNVENVAGTQYKDIMTGDSSSNLLIGGYDHSAATVTANDDTISGGAGADTIVGDVMVDAIIEGIEAIAGVAGNIYAGSDVLRGGSEDDKIYGDSAPILSTSTISVAADQSVEYVVDTIDGTFVTVYGGNDTLQGGTGNDYLEGGSGFDTVDFSSSAAKVVVNLGLSGSVGDASGEGSDQLYNIENIIGSIYGDTLAGNELVNTINGGTAGSDWVDYGYASGVTVDLGAGIAVVGGGDTDTLISIENVLGSNVADALTDKSGTANTLLGLNGDDILYSHNNNTGGTDSYDGGNGIDTIDYSLSSGNLHVTLGGSTNIDTLSNIENVTGATGNDTLVGDTNANMLKGMDGADTLMGAAGADALDGGAGQDMADYSTSNSITVNLTAGTVIDGLGSTDTLTSIEIVKGSNAADIMTGSLLSDTLIGSSGNDTFFASSGSDIYYGNDTLNSADANSNGDKVDYSVAIAGVDNIFADLSSNSVYLRAGAATLSTDTLNSIEEVYGTTGNDTMIGRSSSINTLSGGDGDDTLTGNTDGDVLGGGDGTNLADYSARYVNLTVDLTVSSKNVFTGATATATNSDTLTNFQNVTTGSGNDKLTGNSDANILTGGEGNDTFIGGAGDDTFVGGTDTTHDSGNDTADYSTVQFVGVAANLTTNSVVGEGTDTLYGIKNIIGSAQDDTIRGKVGVVNTLNGGGGNDTLYGGLDGDSINGSTGINTVDYSSEITNVAINLNTSKANYTATSAVYDTLIAIQNATAGSGDDTLIGKSTMVNTLSGGDGNDILTGNLDGDLLDGQADTSGDTANYGAYMASTNITVDMGAQSIAQSGSATAKDYFANIEKIQTGAGADTFTLNSVLDTGAYTLDGSAGIDTIDYGAISEAIAVTLNTTNDTTVTVGAAGGNDEVIRNIENVKGSKVNDILTGDSLSNQLYGNEGDDLLDGGAGSDFIYGGDNNDTIIGTQDGVADFYYGGNGSTDTGTADKIDYTAVASNMTLTSGTNVTDSTNSIGSDVLSGIEIFDSGHGDDTLTAGSAGMTIYGNEGIDKITGGSGSDVLYGDNATYSHTATESSNTLAGGAGNDTIYAGGNGDSLRGDAGNDTIYGGAGVDTLDYVTNNIAITALLNTGIINGDGSDVVDTATIEILRSGMGADVITGADSDFLATIYSGAGNDIINGGALDETIYGEAGNDTIRGGTGIDEIDGGANNDLIYGDIDGDTVYGGSESDTLDFSDLSSALVIDMVHGTVNAGDSTFSEIENITGGSGDDQITGDSNANTLKGSAGNDTIFTSDGIDFIDGGSGTADVVDFSAITTAAVNVNLSTLQIINDGYGKAETIQNIEIINGGNYTTAGDTLYGDGMDNIIYGNLGADQLSGNDGADILYGDNATNSNGVGDGHNIINGDAGNDTLYAGDSGDTLSGGSGADKLNGAVGADTLVGGTGDDTLDGGGGIDVADYRNATAKVVITSISPANPNDTTDLTTGVLSGTEGTDIITNTVEVIYGSSGYGDTMTGNANTNIFYGWGGNDTLSGGLGNDTIYGGTGDDIVAGDGGNDLLVGGDIIGTLAGWDTVDYSTDIAGIALNLTTGTATDGSGGTDTLSGFSKVLGSNFADTITGNVGADDLRGGGGDDWLVMSAGNDTIYGGTTTETTGDTVDFSAATTTGVIVNLATNNASGTDIGTDVIYEVENVSGSNFADTITGDANANTLVGRALNDTIVAGAGTDVIYGDDNVLDANFDGIQTGNDSLYGQDGNDTMYGGLGNDNMWGGNNDDTLYGGTGDDYINGENGINVLFGNDGNDTFELNVTTATNTITGGTGTDTLYFYNAAAVTINLATLSSAQATGGGGSVMLLDSIKNIVGSNGGADAITGNALANAIWSYNGNDLVYGAGGIDTIYGGAGADRLYGDIAVPTVTDGGNTLYGGEGNDTLYGGLGNDTLNGDDGGSYATTCNDTFFAISGSDGNDSMDGGQGTDTADYTAVSASNNISVTLNGSTAATVTVTDPLHTVLSTDTVVNIENFIGGSGNDNIVGDGNWNYLNGGSGTDTLTGAAGNDILTDTVGTNTFAGGAGNDTITGIAATSWLDYSIDGIIIIDEGASTDLRTTSGQAISASRGSDTIANVNHITGSVYNDNFSGNASINTINSGDGNDVIEGYGGSDILDGGSGTDTVTYLNENKISVTLLDDGIATNVGVWNGTNFTTEVDIVSNFENIAGSNSTTAALNSDTISGNSSANTIWGYAGNDLLYGAGGNDVLDGGESNDTIAGGTGADNILGGNGNDVLRGGGTAYNSVNTADGFSDTILGGAGQDSVYGMMDSDTLYGNDATTIDGIDWLKYDEYFGAIVVDLATNIAHNASATAQDSIIGFTHVSALNDDTSTSTFYDNVVYGNVSSNWVTFGSGNDSFYASNGASTQGSYGSDVITMGAGNDNLNFYATELTSGDTINGGDGTDTMFVRDTATASNVTTSSFSNVSNVEVIHLASILNEANAITLDKNDVTIIGGTYNDTFNYSLSAFDAHDILDGSGGTDTLNFLTAGTLTSAMLGSISNIEKIQLFNGTNTVSVDVSATGATLLGGTGADTFNYSIGNLASDDIIDAGNGTDTLAFLDAGTITDTQFANITHIEKVQMYAGTNTFNIGAGESYLSGVSLIGTTGVDTFVYTAAALSDATANASIIGASSNDILKITGSSGLDSVVDANFSRISAIATLDLSAYTGSGASIALGANATAMGLNTVNASGNTNAMTIDASAMTSAVTINAGSGLDTLRGGSVADVFNITAAKAVIAGNGGIDTLNINGAITQDGSVITSVETINVNADTSLTGGLSVSTLSIASAKTLTMDAGLISGDTTSFANSGTLVLNNATTGNTFSTLTMTGSGALKVNVDNNSSTVSLSGMTVGGYSGTITLTGGAGDDVLTGTSRADTIYGGTGNDILIGGSGTDYLDGGANDDTYRFMAATDILLDVINDTGGGTDLIWADFDAATVNFSGVTATGIEGLKFYQGGTAQTLTISKAQAAMYTDFTGYSGATDTLSVTAVTASLDMNSGKNYTNVSKVIVDASTSAGITLTGAASVSNNITGGSGADIIIAGQQADALDGGALNDTFQFFSSYLNSSDAVNGNSGTDTLQIMDSATIAASQLTGVTGVEILKLAANSTATMGGSLNAVDLSAGGVNVVNNSTVSNITITGGAGNDTLNISGSVAIDVSKITGVEAINITAGSSAITNTFAGAPTVTIASGATLTSGSSGDSVTGKTIIANGTLSATNINGTDISHLTLNSGGTANLTLSAGGSLDSSAAGFTRDAGGILKINASTGDETITIDSAKFGVNANDAITDTSGADILIVKGSNTIDFTKIAGMETVNLTNYTGTTLTTNNTTGETVKINSYYTSINTGGGTDQLYISANSVDLSTSTLSGIESYYVAAGATLIIKAADVSGKNVTGGGDVKVVMSADSNAVLTGITSSGAKILDITTTLTFSGTLGTISQITVDSGTATIAANILTTKTVALSGAGGLIINADSTASNNNFASITGSMTGGVTLKNTTIGLDLSNVTIGLAITKIDTSASMTLSGAEVNNGITTFMGSGNITIASGSGINVDLSAKDISAYAGIVTLNSTGSAAQTLTGTAHADTINVSNALATVNAGDGSDTINLTVVPSSIDGGANTTGTGDVLNINSTGLTINASNITNVETINVNQSTTLTGSLSTTAVHIATGTTLTADASVVSAEVINNLTTNGTVAVTNLQGTLAADLSTLTTTTVNATWSSSTATYTGNLTNVDTLTISGGTMRVADTIVSAHAVTGGGSIIVNVTGNTAIDLSGIAAGLSETVNFTGAIGSYTQNLANTDAITLASGASADLSGATIGASTTSVTGAAGSESLTINSSFLHAASSIDLGTSSDTLAITSNTALSAADFGKIHGVETLNLTNYTGTADLTSTDLNEITTLQTGSNVNSITIDYAMNVTDTGGTDILNVTASSIDLSTKTVTGIETMNLAAYTGLTLSEAQARGSLINGSASGSLTVSGNLAASLTLASYAGDVTVANANGQSVTLAGGADTITDTATAGSANTLNAGAGNDIYNIAEAINIADTSGTDILTVTASSIDLSGKIVTSIETLALGTTTGTMLNATETSNMNITGDAASTFTISDSGGADSVNLTSDLSSFSGTFSFNGGTGNDNMTLDFTKLGNLTMDGGVDTDTLALSGLSGSHITTANMSNISNVETLDISSIDLSTASLTIDFNALWNLGVTSDLAQTGGYNTINLDVLGTDTTNLTISDMISPAFTTTGAYDITDGTNTLHMIVA